MRRTAISAATLAAAAALLSPTSATAQTADTEPPRLVDVTLSQSTVAVSGLDSASVTVSVHLTDNVGVVPATDMDGGSLPVVVLERTAGAASNGNRFDVRDLALSTGTTQDGIWTAVVRVPSTYNGAWQVSRVVAVDTAFNRLDVDPRTRGIIRQLSVAGTHLPAVSMGFFPAVLQRGRPISVKGRAYFVDTGAPIAGRPLVACNDNLCIDDADAGIGSVRIVTDAAGYYGVTWPAAGAEFLKGIDLVIPAPTTGHFQPELVAWAVARRDFPPTIQPVVPARVTQTPIKLGGTTTIEGNVIPLSASEIVYLQRLAGGVWKNIRSVRIRASGRYTLLAQPPTVGNHRYRVFKPRAGTKAVAISPTLLVGAF